MAFLEQNKKTTIYFGIVLLTYIAILVFLLFFAPGIELTQQETASGVELFVENQAAHPVQDIKVYTSSGKQLLYIPVLEPNQKEQVPLGGLSGVIVVNATARFHATAQKTVFLKGTKGVKVSYESAYPNIALVGEKFTIAVKVCNIGSIELEKVAVKETHGIDYFGETEQEQTIPRLKTNDCAKTSFEFTARKKGETQIYFNIKALDVSEEFYSTIKIEEV